MLSDIVKRNKFFCKRKKTVLKKTYQLAVLSEADIIVFLSYRFQIIAYNKNYRKT